MRVSVCLALLVSLVSAGTNVFAQNWSFDARTIALGGVGEAGSIVTTMVEKDRKYWPIGLPFGLVQILSDVDVFDPDSAEYDPIRSVEYAASPIHYVVGRGDSNSGQAAFVRDIRNSQLSRDLTRYKGFGPANDFLAEGLTAPNFGRTIKLHQAERGGFHGIYVGAGPYLSLHSVASIDRGLTGVFASGVNVPNAHFPIANDNEVQIALAVTGGYRGRFAWPVGIGAGSDREGLYVGANYNYLRGFFYSNVDMAITLDTDSAGLLTLVPATTPVVITTRDATRAAGFALDVGAAAVVDRWTVGFGVMGIANRLNWSSLEQTTYTLESLIAGADFRETTSLAAGDTRVELPVDYRGIVAYAADQWSAAAEMGRGFGGALFHGGYERRVDRVELRGGARYTTRKWNPTGGIGVDLSRRVALDLAAFGTHANIERRRQLALAASFRITDVR